MEFDKFRKTVSPGDIIECIGGTEHLSYHIVVDTYTTESGSYALAAHTLYARPAEYMKPGELHHLYLEEFEERNDENAVGILYKHGNICH